MRKPNRFKASKRQRQLSAYDRLVKHQKTFQGYLEDGSYHMDHVTIVLRLANIQRQIKQLESKLF